MVVHRKWQPIQPVEPDSEQYDFSEIKSLQQQWLTIRRELQSSNSQVYQSFLERLDRSWAIETGIIEGLYTLDRGVTETLIEKGIIADFIERGDTNRDPQDLVLVLKDQEEAIEFVYQYIRQGHPLKRSFIRQLHRVFTGHQDTYSAIDQFGTRFDALLDKGGFKKHPNNPTRQDGIVHEYCPPEHVDSEIDNLLYFYNEMQKEQNSFHPLLTGAWLHHAFTQIHPFQDGNGRVARALLTWHLVKEDFLPIVVSRDDRERYIDALESADRGKLIPFVDLLVKLEKNTIFQVLGEPEPEAQPALVDQVLDHIVDRINLQNEARENQMRSVIGVALAIRDQAQPFLSEYAEQISGRLGDAGRRMECFVDKGGPGDKEHWYRNQVIRTANNSRQWVNLNEARFFLKLSFTPEKTSRYPRLIFVISLHQIGRQLTGIMAATAFALIEHYHDNLPEMSEESASASFEDCTLDPFTFTWENDPESLSSRFKAWTEQRLAIAIAKWGPYLT